MSDITATTTPMPTAPAPAQNTVTPETRIIQWNANGEAWIPGDARDEIADEIGEVTAAKAKEAFPIHETWGTLLLHRNGTTILVQSSAGLFCVGDFLPRDAARPRAVPASGVVDISVLDPKMQEAVMTLLGRVNRK